MSGGNGATSDNPHRIPGGGPFRSDLCRYNGGLSQSDAPLPTDLDLCQEIIRQLAATIEEA